MNEIYEFILDFVSHWHGISHNVSVEKDKVTVTTFPGFGVELHDFANAKEATEFIIKEYGWPTKADGSIPPGYNVQVLQKLSRYKD